MSEKIQSIINSVWLRGMLRLVARRDRASASMRDLETYFRDASRERARLVALVEAIDRDVMLAKGRIANACEV